MTIPCVALAHSHVILEAVPDEFCTGYRQRIVLKPITCTPPCFQNLRDRCAHLLGLSQERRGASKANHTVATHPLRTPPTLLGLLPRTSAKNRCNSLSVHALRVGASECVYQRTLSTRTGRGKCGRNELEIMHTSKASTQCRIRFRSSGTLAQSDMDNGEPVTGQMPPEALVHK
eukprot:634206-Amphidinium_carterae.1